MSFVSTSRVGRKPVAIPAGVEVSVAGLDLAIKGPKGSFELSLHPSVDVSVEDGMVKVKSNPDAGYCRNGSGSKLIKAITGTTRARISNMIHGVANLFERKLLLVGVGYKAQSKGKTLGLTLGYSHPIDFEVPEGITIETPTPTEIIVKGIDKDLVGLVSSKIRSYRAPEPYKGKGIKYSDEKIVRKETKKK
jgi:large subunit ribosomal protein L6